MGKSIDHPSFQKCALIVYSEYECAYVLTTSAYYNLGIYVSVYDDSAIMLVRYYRGNGKLLQKIEHRSTIISVFMFL